MSITMTIVRYIKSQVPLARLTIDVTHPHVQVVVRPSRHLAEHTYRGNVTPYGGAYVLAAPGEPLLEVPEELHLSTVKQRLGDEMTITKKDGEYRVNYRGGDERSASYHTDLLDALQTGIHMRDNRNPADHWQRTGNHIHRCGKHKIERREDHGISHYVATWGSVHLGTTCDHDERAHPCSDAFQEAMKLCDGEPRLPTNMDVHQNLIALGYTHTYTPADGGDQGDAENGPSYKGGHDEFDTYESDHDYVIIDHAGRFAHYEVRDHALEQFLERGNA
jgi:hypothetical protein